MSIYKKKKFVRKNQPYSIYEIYILIACTCKWYGVDAVYLYIVCLFTCFFGQVTRRKCSLLYWKCCGGLLVPRLEMCL